MLRRFLASLLAAAAALTSVVQPAYAAPSQVQGFQVASCPSSATPPAAVPGFTYVAVDPHGNVCLSSSGGGSSSVTLNTGTNIAGVFGIDNTTQGSTNRVTQQTVIAPITKTFTEQASYSAGNALGPLETYDLSGTVGATAAWVRVSSVMLVCTATAITGGNTNVLFVFGNAPSTAITDGSTPSFNSADIPEAILVLTLNTAIPGTGGMVWSYLPVEPGSSVIRTGSDGKIRMYSTISGAPTITTPTGCTWTATFSVAQ